MGRGGLNAVLFIHLTRPCLTHRKGCLGLPLRPHFRPELNRILDAREYAATQIVIEPASVLADPVEVPGTE